MVLVTKKIKTYHTIDLQRLNAQCYRETHHCQSPFQLACQIPPNTRKTILDAVDGFPAIEIDKASHKLTTFITEWGRYHCCHLPQRYLAATDVCTRRYGNIIRDVPNKVKYVDDTLLYDCDIEAAFNHTCDYLKLYCDKGIVFNKNKFQFCEDSVEFAGLKIMPSWILLSDHILTASQDFPTPKTLTDTQSWFGLVNLVAWAYAILPTVQPFQDLVKSLSQFYKIFQNSKSSNQSSY